MKSYLFVIILLLSSGCNRLSNTPEPDVNVESLVNTGVKGENEKQVKPHIRISSNDYAKKLKSEQAKRDSILNQLEALYWESDSSVVVIGIIQSSGIRQFDDLGVRSEYQVINPFKCFFLESNKALSPFWGYCVKIVGRYPAGWNYKTGHGQNNISFGRSALHVDSIQIVSTDFCNNSPIFIPVSEPTFEKNKRDSVFRGIIQRNERPAPDISYDYQIILSEPLRVKHDNFDTVYSLPLTINMSLDTLNYIIENNKMVSINGIITGAYAEGIVLNGKEFIGFE